jgi:hypothetical protein
MSEPKNLWINIKIFLFRIGDLAPFRQISRLPLPTFKKNSGSRIAAPLILFTHVCNNFVMKEEKDA